MPNETAKRGKWEEWLDTGTIVAGGASTATPPAGKGKWEEWLGDLSLIHI